MLVHGEKILDLFLSSEYQLLELHINTQKMATSDY